MARPTRTRVAPSPTATSKSSVIPIERCRHSTPGTSSASASRKRRKAAKTGRACSGSATTGVGPDGYQESFGESLGRGLAEGLVDGMFNALFGDSGKTKAPPQQKHWLGSTIQTSVSSPR